MSDKKLIDSSNFPAFDPYNFQIKNQMYGNTGGNCMVGTTEFRLPIRNVVLEEVVLQNLREAIAYVSQYEQDFIREASDISVREQDRELAAKKDKLAKAEKRVTELDLIIKRLYEDNINGKLTDERFIKLSRDYEREQDEQKTVIVETSRELKERERSRTNVKSFITATKKYTDLKVLDATVLREFIDRINVSAVDRKSKTRDIEIVYNFIGAFDFSSATEQTKNHAEQAKNGIA